MKRIVLMFGFGIVTLGATYFAITQSKHAQELQLPVEKATKRVQSSDVSKANPIIPAIAETHQIDAELKNRELVSNIEEQVQLSSFENSAALESELVAKLLIQLSPADLRELRALRANSTVRFADGRLAAAYAQNSDCDEGSCIPTIVKKINGNIVWKRVWAQGYMETGVGKEVVWREQK